MKRLITLTFFFAGTAGLFLLVPVLQAHAAAGDFTLSNDQYQFTIDRATLASWRGEFVTPMLSYVIRPKLYTEGNLGPLIIVSDYIGATNYGALGYNPAGTPQIYHYDPSAVYNWIKKIAPTISAEAKEPKLVIENGRATEFQPPLPGELLDSYRTSLNVLDALEQKDSSAELATQATGPKQSLGGLNNLGIKELIGHGVSSFAGSPHNRTINIHVGVEKMQGVIITPGQTFSFNKYLGPVEASEGFVPELVIKAEGTIPELGGGLCQVSSTTFRAAMDAGLPIVERRNHAYAVQYYAPQGTDATIYPGVVDLKFTNDTPGSILVWPWFKDKTTLVYDFYGTADDRQIIIDKPIQFDRKSDGSMKATWSRTVVKNGQARRDVFQSVYRSPALYHKHEEFVSAPPGTTGETPTPNPIPNPVPAPIPGPEPPPATPTMPLSNPSSN